MTSPSFCTVVWTPPLHNLTAQVECEYTKQYGGKTQMQLQPGSIGLANISLASCAVPLCLAPCPFSLGICCDTPFLLPFNSP